MRNTHLFYQYDKKGQLTHLNTNTRLTSTHQSPNHLAKQVNHFNRTHQYTYDKLGRLTQHKLADHQTHTGHTETFAFDPASNRVPLPQTNTQTAHQGIDQRTKRPTSLISQGKLISYSYDVHGNIKTKTETPLNPKTNKPIYQSDNGLIGYRKSIQFTYNPNNELKQTITIIDTGLQVQRITTQYHYDAFGRRIAKNSKVERLNKLNQRGELVRYPTVLMHLSKTQKTVQQTTLMLWEGNRQIQEYTDHHIFTTVYDDQSFEPVSRLVQSRDKTCDDLKIYHYHNNHLGTPQELTNEQGEVVWCNYEYAWGGRYTHHYISQNLNDCAILEHELQPIRFQGQYYDPETSLHYNRFRYYDSDVGMFIGRDPIGLLGGLNTFQYAPNPIHWIDPFGLDVHHIIPNAVYSQFKKQLKGLSDGNGNRYVQNKNKKGKDKSNLIDLDTPFHGNHPQYNEYVSKRLDEILNKNNNKLNFNDIKSLQNELRDMINDAKTKYPVTGKNLNEYFRDTNRNSPSNKGKNSCTI